MTILLEKQLPAGLPEVIPTYISDSRISQNVPYYHVTALIFSAKTLLTDAVDAMVSVASDRCVARVVREELGEEWEVLTWNATTGPF
ncbi:hypothetical protein [Pantanalinema sp. GBBB05]|uniref:hypothetical protein n=1 Tax=Pantanalinema sp. GBBB05 TaxID=2604139 RepID=UPI001D9764BC|nr:hypothetical protein [Pantanalinema sp. GBBB05]